MNNWILEDWERVAIRERIFVEEEKQLLQQEIKEELRRPAIIYVSDHDKVLSYEHERNTLPF